MRPNLADPDFLRDPAPLLARLRAAGPLAETRVPLVGRVRITTTDAAARALLKDPRFLRDPRGVTGRSMAQTLWFLPRFLAPVLDSMILRDGPAHHRLRTRVERAFGRAAIEDLAPQIAGMADALLDRIDPARPVDLVPAFARPLPLLAVSALLGVPEADRARIARWIAPLSAPRVGTIPLALPGLWRTIRHFRADIAAARRTPRPGLIHALAADGDPLTDDEILSMVVLLFLAGHETTVHLVTDALLSLLADPQVRAGALAAPERLSLAVEEFLRFHSPVMMTKMHYATQDLDFMGERIRKGERLSAFLLAANHDPARVEAPEALRPDRRPNAHLAFGFGPHVCLGLQLARIETRVALERLFARFPDMALAGPAPAYARRFGIRGVPELRVKLRP